MFECSPGSNASDLYRAIVRANIDVKEVFWTTLAVPKTVQQRIAFSPELFPTIELADELRRNTGLPFWESLFIESLRQGHIDERLLDAALFHQKTTSNLRRFPRNEVLAGCLKDLQATPVDGQMNVFMSRVDIGFGEEAHIPMLDFRCEVSSENLRVVQQISSRLFVGDVAILNSGKSYHAVGLKLVCWDELHDLLMKSLMFSPIVDRAYVAHQLLERQCCLRISAKSSNQPPPILEIIISGRS